MYNLCDSVYIIWLYSLTWKRIKMLGLRRRGQIQYTPMNVVKAAIHVFIHIHCIKCNLVLW